MHSILSKNESYYTSTLLYLAGILRKDVIYLVVSQDDQGLGVLSQLRPNILVLSAGGYGHIPIPLIKGNPKPNPDPNPSHDSKSNYGHISIPLIEGEIPYIPPPVKFPIDISFVGQVRPRPS